MGQGVSKIESSMYRTIFNHSPVGITVTDSSERIISWNRFTENLLGMNKKELHLRPVNTLYPKAQWRKIRRYKVRQKGMQHHLETQMIHNGGDVIDVDISISVLKDENGKFTGAIGIIRDISQRKESERVIKENRRALIAANKELSVKSRMLKNALADMEKSNAQLKRIQDALIQSEKMAVIGQMSVGIAHEIKNPLTIILQGIEGIERALAQAGGSDNKHALIIRNAAQRANKVIVELLDFSRTAHFTKKEIDLHSVINNAIAIMRSKAGMEAINISCSFFQATAVIGGDTVLLEEVFLNLFNNAIEAGSRNLNVSTRILSSKKKEGPNLIIEITDDGSGIPEENLSNIFEPFFTTKEKTKGTGLGLALVVFILKRHTGSIKAENRQDSNGAKFIISLPYGFKAS